MGAVMQEKDVNLEVVGREEREQRERTRGSYVNKDGRNTGFSRPKRGKLVKSHSREGLRPRRKTVHHDAL